VQGSGALGSFTAPRPYGRRRKNPLVTLLIVFGVTIAFPGVLLDALCLPADGMICQGTGIGDIGRTFLLIGVGPLVAGVVLAIVLRRRGASAPQTPAVDPVAQARSAQMASAQATLRLNAPGGGFETPTGPPPSKCPECGAPVPRGAAVCDYCGQTFQ
jgi:hypothetical protein